MSHEDILDDMSLSDDEMLDSLADDMLLEMENEENEHIETIEPVRRTAPALAMPIGFPFAAPGGRNGGGGMPDLSQMMSQMMPMMSQMFGGGGAPGLQGGRGSLQQQQLSWEEIIKKHVPPSEQDDWLQTVRADSKLQLENLSRKVYGNPSRSYHGNAKPLPNVYMESETLLASLLNEAVRAKKAEHNPRWSQYHDNIISQLTQSGLAAVYTRALKEQLRRRVDSDPDFEAAGLENPSRFANIAKALRT